MSFIHLATVRRKSGKKSKEVGFHAQIHSSRVNKHRQWRSTGNSRINIHASEIFENFTQLLRRAIARRPGKSRERDKRGTAKILTRVLFLRHASCRRQGSANPGGTLQFHKFDNDNLTPMLLAPVNDTF